MTYAFYDTECYPNYWLLKIKVPDGYKWLTFELREGETFSNEECNAIRHIFAHYTMVSFNGINYDRPMISAALSGYAPNQLKWLNDQIIVDQVKHWEIDLPFWLDFDHIDIIEVVPGKGSLKQYVGRRHGHKIQDLPYDPAEWLNDEQIYNVDLYCENDCSELEDLFYDIKPLIEQREFLSARYGIDLRSKSDAQLAEAVLKIRCEQATGRKIYKPEIDYNAKFRFDIPSYVQYTLPQLQQALNLVREAVFEIEYSGKIKMPQQLDGLTINIGKSQYKLGIGGLHSKEEVAVHKSDATHILRDNDVASYYPSLILNSGKWPPSMGQAFLQEYKAILDERLVAKIEQGRLKKSGDTSSKEYKAAEVGNEGAKIMLNGTFGKCGSPYSILFAPSMLIQTTLSGQLALLMLIEWHEAYGIPVVSANTDGIVIKCQRDKVYISEALIEEWEKRTNLTMETLEYSSIYSRDVNNYFAVKLDGEVKRKGEYNNAGLIQKKNPDVEICSDAVSDFLSKGIPIEYTIGACVDIRKFVTVQKVAGGGVKMWGEGPRKGALVRDIIPVLEANGWRKVGRKWVKYNERDDGFGPEFSANEAYEKCFILQRPEYLGKVCRWYYGINSPGPVVYHSNGNTVSLSYGATPCMTLPDKLPDDIDYAWYVNKAESILKDIGYYNLGE